MVLKRWSWFSIGILLLMVSVTAAQDSTAPSMRDYADKSGFHIGAAVYTTHLANPVHVQTLSREYNMLTPENEAKLCEVQPSLGQFKFDNFDRLVDFAEENNMMVRGHTLVWHQCVPNWLANGTFTRDEAIEILRNSIYTEVGRYKGRIAIWDVVNEALGDGGGLRDTPWRRLIGDDYIELAFRFAHEADPDALLFYNDYGTEGMNAKSDAVYAMVKDFIARGVPINGVGLQSHLTVGDTRPSGGLPADALAQNIQRLGELGVQVQITELDVRHAGKPTDAILQRQAADYRRVFDTCLASEYCTAIVTWGVSDRYTWLRGANLGFFNNPDTTALLFDDDYKPKPAYTAVLDALARHAGQTPIMTDEEINTLLGDAAATTAASELPPPTKSDPKQFAPDSVPGTIYYAPFPVKITLDGDDKDWAYVPRATVDNGPLLPPNNDTSMTFAAAADKNNLYFLADVKDSNIVYGQNDPATQWYMEDSVEFYLNTTDNLDATSYAPGIAQIAILAANLTNPDSLIIGGGNSADSKVQAVVVKTDDGYRIEAAVPLVTDVWSIKPKQSVEIGFQVHLNGSSGAGRDTKLIWSLADTDDQSYTNPSLFGRLFFWFRSI